MVHYRDGTEDNSPAIATAAKPVRSTGEQSRQYAQQLLQSVLKEAFKQKGKVYEVKEDVCYSAEK